MEERLTDRAQAYWETLQIGTTIDAETLFENAKRPKDLREDIKYIRGFLSQKFNDGLALLTPSQSPPIYIKLDPNIPAIELCTILFNDIPTGEKLTTYSFYNRLPQKLRNMKKVSNFFHRAKVCGAITAVTDASGVEEKIKKNKYSYTLVEKRKNIKNLPSTGIIPRNITKSPPAKSKVTSQKMVSKIFGMKASEVGLSIFELLNKLLTENENQQTKINDLVKSLNDCQTENKKVTEELYTREAKDPTYAEIYRKIP